MKIDIPGMEPMVINTIVLDLNGTLAIDGNIIEGAAERIKKLKDKSLNILLFTGNTHGNGEKVAKALDIELYIIPSAKHKRDAIKKLYPVTTAAIGNGKIDLELFPSVCLRIATLQAEGIYAPLLAECDIIVPNINDALDLFLYEKRMIGTLRE